jgi:hypothetical protein
MEDEFLILFFTMTIMVGVINLLLIALIFKRLNLKLSGIDRRILELGISKKLCPKCGRPIEEHTLAQLKECGLELKDFT